MGRADSAGVSLKPRVAIRNGYFYVDGEKFFIKGVGYSGYRPHQKPTDPVSLELMEEDFSRIKDAGFNTIRTWFPFDSQQLELAKKYDLWVIQGTLSNLEDTISHPPYMPKVIKMIEDEVIQTNGADNILMYLFANEISVSKVQGEGVREADKTLRDFRRQLEPLNLKAPVSIANFPLLVFLDDSIWDAACYNVYTFNPYSVTYPMGYRGFLDWLKENRAKDKPLVITEYGVSVSPSLKGIEQQYGFGGNTEQLQQEGIISMLNEIVAAKAAGACVFEWIDEWWKNYDQAQDETCHDDDPEEWFGLLKVDSDLPQDIIGTPRPAYYALKEYNQAILVEPRDMCYYPASVPVEVYCTEDIASVECRTDSGRWVSLKKSGDHWWKTTLKFRGKGEKTVELIARQKDKTEHRRKARIFIYKREKIDKQLNIKVLTDKRVYKKWESIKIDISLKDGSGKAVKDKMVKIGIFEPNTWIESELTKTTDQKGQCRHRYASPRTGPILISAGTDFEVNGYKRSFGDLVWVDIE